MTITREDIQRISDCMDAEWKKPRAVCKCEEFTPGEVHWCLAMVQCKVCRGWFTMDQLQFGNIKIRKEK